MHLLIQDAMEGTQTWTYTYTVTKPTWTVPADGTSTVACAASATAPTAPVVTGQLWTHDHFRCSSTGDRYSLRWHGEICLYLYGMRWKRNAPRKHGPILTQ